MAGRGERAHIDANMDMIKKSAEAKRALAKGMTLPKDAQDHMMGLGQEDDGRDAEVRQRPRCPEGVPAHGPRQEEVVLVRHELP